MKPIIFVFAVLLLFTETVVAQDDPQTSKRVHPITVPTELSNTVGGNYVDSYVVHLQQGQSLHIQIENKTQYSKVSFDTVLAGTETRFGRDESDTSWSGVAPQTGDYEIRLIAYPVAEYRLLVSSTRAGEDEKTTASERGVNNHRRAAYSYGKRRRGK